jgi:multiple sugar transport system ATP-binding protein
MKVTMGIRPEDIHDNLFAEIKNNANTISAQVEMVENMGSHKVVHFKTGSVGFSAELRNFNENNQQVDLIFDMNKSHFFDANNGRSI